MQALPKWRLCALTLKNGLVSNSPSTQLAMFHSTPISCRKWNVPDTQWSQRDQKPSKNAIRYAVRQKRSDTKKALNDLLYRGVGFRVSHQNEKPSRKANKSGSRDAKKANDFGRFNNKIGSKASARGAKQEHYRNRKLQRKIFCEDFEYPETVLEGVPGNSFTWSFRCQSFHFDIPTSGFDWREDWEEDWGEEEPNRKHYSTNKRAASSDSESDNESCCMGLTYERKVLGLTSSGPLKLEEVKTAFRSSALKWHPDKHMGPSKAMAEEKFKLCADAYKSLCSALTPS